MLRRPVVVRARPGLLGTVARTAVVAGTATVTANAISNRQNRRQQAAMEEQAAQQAVAQQQQQIEQLQQQVDSMAAPAPAPAAPAAPAAAPSPSGGTDVMAKLKELAEMKASGILTDEEFAAAKAKILAA